ncbi:aminopeptidase [Endozoicomonas montiporae]|uniref:Aminopeptidase n=2 Tax=Endozoicomonas montiporae TaxID=1027273 RepID=A0A081N593_9GAMM|nr:PA4642 family protein [Endozoicomonas montiporae]KEQ13616.1 aminopeptidase [Endozoicomonas montiporae]
MKKDKKKVIGETLSDARIQELLTLQPPAGENRAFHILTRAYRTLREDDFSRFMVFYTEAELDLNPCNRSGHYFVDVIARHQHSEPYLRALQAAGHH